MSVCSRMARPRIANPFYAGSSPVTDSSLAKFPDGQKYGLPNR